MEADKGVVDLMSANADSKGGKTLRVSQVVYRAPNPSQITAGKAHFKATTAAGRYSSVKDFAPDNQGDVVVSPLAVKSIEGQYGPGIEVTQTITLPMKDFPRWPWLDGDVMTDSQATKQSLYEQYQIIWQAMHDKNLAPIKPWLIKSNKEVSQALSAPAVFKGSQLQLIQSDIANPNYKLMPLPKEEDLSLRVSGNGKLARLVVKNPKLLQGINETPVVFYSKKEGWLRMHYFAFYKKDGNWVLYVLLNTLKKIKPINCFNNIISPLKQADTFSSMLSDKQYLSIALSISANSADTTKIYQLTIGNQ